MEDNPYNRLAEELRRMGKEGNRPAFRTGVVVSLVPLTISCGGLTLAGEDLCVNPLLLPRKEPVTMTLTGGVLEGPGFATEGELRLTGKTLEGEAQYPGLLAPGSRVAMLTTEEDNLFFVVCTCEAVTV